jgi:DnaJ-class molecular chaperone
MISSFTSERSAELAVEAGASGVREAPIPIACPHCGGSGILRMGDQRFRTCLECLGQGQLNRTVQQELLFPSFGLRVSASRAG